MNDHIPFREGSSVVRLPLHLQKQEVLMVIGTIFEDIRYVKEDLGELEDLICQILHDYQKTAVVSDSLK